MDIQTLIHSLDILERDFRHVPDREKDFPALQNRLEVLLQEVTNLSELERKSLMPMLERFQGFLKEHLDTIQEEAALLQMDLQEKKTHKQAVAAYGSYKGSPKR